MTRSSTTKSEVRSKGKYDEAPRRESDRVCEQEHSLATLVVYQRRQDFFLPSAIDKEMGHSQVYEHCPTQEIYEVCI